MGGSWGGRERQREDEEKAEGLKKGCRGQIPKDQGARGSICDEETCILIGLTIY